VTLGFISGYKGGLVDHAIRTFIDSFLVIPVWPIFMIIATYIPKLTLTSVSILLAIFGWGGAARTIRAQVLSQGTRICKISKNEWIRRLRNSIL